MLAPQWAGAAGRRLSWTVGTRDGLISAARFCQFLGWKLLLVEPSSPGPSSAGGYTKVTRCLKPTGGWE